MNVISVPFILLEVVKRSGFMNFYDVDPTKTLLGKKKLDMFQHLISITKNLEGHVAEVGVYKGGTASLLARHFKDNFVFLFDTFEGLPGKEISSDSEEGLFASPISEVIKFLDEHDNIIYLKGLFEEQYVAINNIKKFKFVHLDADIENTQRLGLEIFYEKLETGGIICLDDYGNPNWPGTKIAADKFCEQKNIPYPFVSVAELENKQFQSFIIKS